MRKYFRLSENAQGVYYTIYLCVLLLSIHILSVKLLGVMNLGTFIQLFAAGPTVNPQLGHLTAMFVHYDTTHVMTNIALIVVSFPIALYHIDVRKVFSIFVVGGLVAIFVFAVVGHVSGYQTPVIGASGGAFAVFANCLVLSADKVQSKQMLRYSMIPATVVLVEILRAVLFEHQLLIADSWYVNMVHSTGAVIGYALTVAYLSRQS